MTSGGWRLTFGAAILTACVVAPATAHAEAACAWSSTELPKPVGAAVSDVTAADPTGSWVLANGYADGREAAWVWHNGEGRAVPLPSGSSIATDVNGSGVVLSYSYDSKNAFKHHPDGRVEQLPRREGAALAWPDNINAAGDVAGQSGGQYIQAVVLWPADAPGTVRVLPGSDNGRYWTVTDIDEAGRVVAYEVAPGGVNWAFVWDRAGNRTQLQPLEGHGSSKPYAFRNGRIVGYSSVTSYGADGQLVEWDLTGKVVRTFPGLDNARDVNSAGHVLGTGPATPNYGVWRSEGDFTPLPDHYGGSTLAEDGAVYGLLSDPNGQTSGNKVVRLRCE